MAKVLVGYERGENLGHYRRLEPVARMLASDGHDVTMFLRNLYDCRRLIAEHPVPFLQAPDLVSPNPAERGPKRMGAFSDIMAYCGFAEEQTLFVASLAWRTVLDHVRPDLIVCDHSPIVCLAAHGRIPVVQIGSGFTLPPADGDVFPAFRDGQRPTIDPDGLVYVINRVQDRFRGPRVRSVTEPFRTRGRLVCTLKGLDPYGPLRKDPVIGPTEGLLPPLTWPKDARVFVYLDAKHAVTHALLTVFKEWDIPVNAYVRGMTADMAQRVAHSGMVLYKTPQPIRHMLQAASLVIHHGGSGLSLACCGAGRPQVTLPTHQESALNARALERAGVGVTLTREDLDECGASKLAGIEADAERRERARAMALEIARGNRPRTLEYIRAACYHAVQSGPATDCGRLCPRS